MRVKIIIVALVLTLFTTMSFAQGFGFGTQPFDQDWSDKIERLDEELNRFNEQMMRRFGFYVPLFDRGWQRGIPPKLYEELKLTDEQKSKLEKLYFDFRKNQADIAGKLNKARIELRELLSAEKLDKSAIDKKVDEISGYTRDLFKNRVNYWFNILQVLTPEQRKILKEKFGYRYGLGFGGWGRAGKGLKLRLHCW
jgi:Spy/CpxP family protein refolding chaperone